MNSTIYTYSVIYSSAEAFKDKIPYVIAIVEAPDGQRQMAQIDGYTEGMTIAIGMEVKKVVKEDKMSYQF